MALPGRRKTSRGSGSSRDLNHLLEDPLNTTRGDRAGQAYIIFGINLMEV